MPNLKSRPANVDLSHRVRSGTLAGIALAALLAGCSPPDPSGPLAAPGSTPGAAGAVELPPAWTATASPTKRPPQPTRTPLAAGVDPLDASGVGAASRTPLPLPPIQSVTAASRTSDYRGWQTVDSALARFMLPATYQVIDLGTGFSELFGAFAQGFVEGMGEFAEGMSEALQLTPTPLSLTGLDKALQFDFVLALEPATQASALLVSEPLPEPRSLELSLHDALASMEGELQVICIELVQGAALPTGRILVDTRDPETGESGRALVWVFLQPDRRWNLIFQAPRASFDSNLESFETSGASFELR